MSLENENRQKYAKLDFPERTCASCHLKTPQLNKHCVHCGKTATRHQMQKEVIPNLPLAQSAGIN